MSDINAINSNINSISNTSSSDSTSNYQSDNEIIDLLRQEGTYATKSVQQVAREFNISAVRAQRILDKLNESAYTSAYTVSSEMSNPYTYTVEDVSDSEISSIEYSV